MRSMFFVRCALVLALVMSAQQSLAQSAPSAFTSGFRYDIAGRLVGAINADPDGSGPLRFAAIRYTYSTSGLITKIEKGELADWQSDSVAPQNWTQFTIFSAEKRSYNAFGHLAASEMSSGTTAYSLVQHNYDAFFYSNCTTVRLNKNAFPTMPVNEFQPLPTDACALGTEGAEGPDRITKQTYNIMGDLLSVRKAFLTPIQQNYATYTYTANHKIETITDANGNKAQYKYDGLDRLSCWIFPSKTTGGTVSGDCVTTGDYEKYTYDDVGNRTSLRKRDGSTLTYVYDALNRMLTKVVPSRADLTAAQTRDVHFRYDLLGRQLTAKYDSANGADGITNIYNGMGELTASTASMGTYSKSLTYLYDAAGNRTRVTHPDNQAFTYAYDALDRLTNVYQGTGTTTTLDRFAYNGDGMLTSRTEGAGASGVSYTWDPIGRLTGQADVIGGTGNNVSWTFSLNPASQITSEARTEVNNAYAYGGLVSVNRPYAVNGLNQYTTAGPATFAYDANGNLTTDGTNTYVYDIENRLVKAIAGSAITNLLYDPLGRLFQTDKGTSATTTKFLYDGDALVSEFSSTNTMTGRYVHGSSAAADDPLVWYTGTGSTTKRWLHADHLGSIIAVTTNTGASFAKNAYDEYGIPGSANQGRFQYTGQAWIPELGMYHYKARIYSPTLGRFLQTDPIGYDDQINLYAYVANDPINNTDSTGEAIDIVLDVAFIAADAADIGRNGINWTNGISLGANIVGAVLPGVTGLGAGTRAIGKAVDTGLASKGVRPSPGSRTFQGQIQDATKKAGGNVTVSRNGQPLFRLRTGGHGRQGGSATPQNVRNVNPRTGEVHMQPGRDRDVSKRDIRELHKAREGQGTSKTRSRNGRCVQLGKCD